MRLSYYRFPYCLREYLNPRRYVKVARHWYERARYGYSFADVWSLDYHLAHILVRALPEYRNGDDCPVIHYLNEDMERNIMGTFSDEEDQAACARWNDMLDEVIDGLNAVYGDVDNPYSLEAHEKLDRSLTLLAKYFPRLWN